MQMQHVTINLAPGAIRHDRMEGRDYIVAPMVMLTEGVHAGSLGSLYYPREELAKTPVVWNMKPIVVYHPKINGRGVSACDPDIVDAYKIGVVMNTHWDEQSAKLRAEAWIEVERANIVDERIMAAVENNQPMELSTGVFTDNDDEPGEWNGETYNATARNYRPDHLALLPDIRGACSLDDGAGFLIANALSHEDTRASLSASLRGRFGNEVWVIDVFDAAVVYEYQDKLWKLMYSKTNDVAALGTDAPVRVRRNVQYRTLEGVLIGNADFPLILRGDAVMADKKELVDALIASPATNWAETDRTGLMAFNDDQLGKMAPKEADPTDPNPAENKAKVEAAAIAGAAAVAAPAPAENAVAPEAKPAISLDQLPPEMQAVYNHGLQTLTKERNELITVITANSDNLFTPEALAAMDVGILQGIAAVAKKPAVVETPQPATGGVPLFIGAAPPAPAANAAKAANNDAPKEQEPLGLPTMKFGDEATK